MVVIDVMVVIDDINVYNNCITYENYSNIILGFDDLINEDYNLKVSC